MDDEIETLLERYSTPWPTGTCDVPRRPGWVPEDPPVGPPKSEGYTGWHRINRAIADGLIPNPMDDPETRRRVSESQSKLKKGVPYYQEIARRNGALAAETLTGKKRPEHSARLRANPPMASVCEDSAKYNAWRSSMGSKTYRIKSPDGGVWVTARVKDWCKIMGYNHVPLYRSVQRGTPCRRGPLKGWSMEVV